MKLQALLIIIGCACFYFAGMTHGTEKRPLNFKRKWSWLDFAFLILFFGGVICIYFGFPKII